MAFRSVFWLASFTAGLLIQTLSAFAGPKPVMVYYMPWFVARPYSGSWGFHWTMDTFDPDAPDAKSQKPIASRYTPLIGPYDSLDPVVLEYQVLLMKLGGIDGVVVDWYGQDQYYDYAVNNARTAALLTYARKAGLNFCLCYEDATIGAEITAGTKNEITVTAATAVSHAQQTMLYAQTNYFRDAAYFRLKGKPVLLNFGPQYFKENSQWLAIFSVLEATNHPAFFTEDNRLPVCEGAFDWPPMSLSEETGGSNVLSDSSLQNYLATFEKKAEAWPAFISSVFPRFHDIYAQTGRSSYGYLADHNGATFQQCLARAATNSSAMIQIVTWNDFGEGTIVEPTKEFGYRDLGVIQDYRRQYLDPGFSYHTNDLTVAVRLYNLRRQFSTNATISAELDRVFTNIVTGNLNAANLQLTEFESKPRQRESAKK